MKIKNKQSLLAALRKDYEYTGKDELADVLAFLKELDVQHDAEAVKRVFAKTATLDLGVQDVDPEPEPEPKDEGTDLGGDETVRALHKELSTAKALIAKQADAATRAKHAASKVEGPAIRSANNIFAKEYNRKAATGKVAFGDADEMTQFNAAFRVYTFNQLSAQNPHLFAEYKAKGFYRDDLDIIEKDASDTLLTAGGALLANTLKSEILWATEEWGVSRYIARNEIMVGNNTSFPRRTANPTMAALSSGAAQSTDLAYDLVTLMPKVCAALILTPMVLFEQSATNLGDTISEALMEAYWNLVDDCFFNGDGTSTYIDQVGLKIGLTGGGTQNTASTQQGSYWTASSNTVSSWTTADFLAPMSLVKNLNTSRAVWIMSRQVYIQGALRLATAATTGMNPGFILNRDNTFMVPSQQRGEAPNGPRAYLLGEPVYFSQRMSTKTSSDAGVIKAFYGDFTTGTLIGHRTALEIASSSEYAFNKRALATRGFGEFGINICGDGRASATECGPICALSAST